MSERNDLIIKQYSDGATLDACAMAHNLSRQRIRQIVRAAGVYRKATPRDAFLGVDITKDSHAALKQEAQQRGLSVSRLVSDTIEEMLKRE